MSLHQTNPYATTDAPSTNTRVDFAPVIILIGASGSGKSTRVKNLDAAWSDLLRRVRALDVMFGGEILVVSADHYFLDERGKYAFVKENLGDAHTACMARFIQLLTADAEGDHPVIVDNTNMRRAERSPYVQVARACQRPVVMLRVQRDPELAARDNAHGVSRDVIERQLANYEDPLPWGPDVIDILDPTDTAAVKKTAREVFAAYLYAAEHRKQG